jgi:hypothetical protein
MSYDPRAVAIKKSVKMVAARITDNTQRREFIRGYVKAEESAVRQRSSRVKGDK